MPISSRQNPLFKALHRIARGRRVSAGVLSIEAETAILLEGLHLCQDWLRHYGAPAYAIFDDAAMQVDTEIQQLAQATTHSHQVRMTSTLLASLSHIGASQGVLFVVSAPRPSTPVPSTRSALWLDRVQDPGNVGALLRTAAAAGVETAVLSAGCAGAWSPRVLRAAQGAHFVMTIYEEADLLSLAAALPMPLYATGIGPDSVSLYDLTLVEPCVWIMGNEGQGVDAALLACATQEVAIPHDPRVESLNVVVAAGICLFEQRRQQRNRTNE